MENTPIHPDWQQLKELLDECSSSDTERKTIPSKEMYQIPSEETISIPDYNKSMDSLDPTTNLINKIKKMEGIIEEQNKIIRIRNTYINILEQKLKKLKEKYGSIDDTTYTHIKEISSFDAENRIDTKESTQKIVDLHKSLENLHEQIQRLKNRKESQ